MVQQELLTRLATGTIALGEVTALDHKVLDDTVEGRALVPEALFAGGERAEVFSGLGHRLAVQTQDDAAQVLFAVLDVEVDLVGNLGALGRGGGAAEEQHAHAEEQRGRDDEPPEVEHCGRVLNGVGEVRIWEMYGVIELVERSNGWFGSGRRQCRAELGGGGETEKGRNTFHQAGVAGGRDLVGHMHAGMKLEMQLSRRIPHSRDLQQGPWGKLRPVHSGVHPGSASSRTAGKLLPYYMVVIATWVPR